MARHSLGLTLFILVLIVIFTRRPAAGQEDTPAPPAPGPGQRYTETIPVYDAAALGWEPVVITDTMPAGPERGGASPLSGATSCPLFKSPVQII